MYYQATKQKPYLGKDWLNSLQPPTVFIKAYGGKPVHNLGSCIVYMHNEHKTYRTLCQVMNTKGYFILCREQAQQMNYTQYPEMQPPACAFTLETSLKDIAVKNEKRSNSQVEKDTLRQTNEKQPKDKFKSHKAGLIEPIVLDIEWRDHEIVVNDRTHRLPTTKEYLLREFANVFQGVGGLLGPPYHIRLKENYTPVQHTPWSVPVRMQWNIQSKVRQTDAGKYHNRCQSTHWVGELHCTSDQTRWKHQTMVGP